MNEVHSWFVQKAAWAESLAVGQRATLLNVNLKS